MKTIGITGGTGFVGRHLISLLTANGDKVIVFSRNKENHQQEKNVSYALWHPEKGICDTDALAQVNAMVHLAGAGIADKRWTDKRKKEIVNSRVIGTTFLVSQLKAHAPACTALIAASAIGFYGPDKPEQPPFTEDMPCYNDFLGHTCQQWETATHKADDFLRTVVLRFGIVLGKDGGAYPEFEQPMKWSVMPILGSGRQVVSWVHVQDLAAIIKTALYKDGMKGTYNAVSPSPVMHKQLMQTIVRKKGGIKIPIPVPSFILKLLLGEMSIEILKSCTASAKKLIDSGFNFQYPDIDSAVSAIIADKHNR